MGLSPANMFVHHMHAMSSEAKRGHQIPWAGVTDGCSYRMGAEN